MKKTKLVSELTLAVQKGLMENGHTKTAKIKVDADATHLTIGGTVHTYYHKQMVLNVVLKFSGQMDIMDEVIVS